MVDWIRGSDGSRRASRRLPDMANRTATHEESCVAPHAKFHNAQTILLGIGLGILTVVLVTIPAVDTQFHLLFAACTASLYWLSMLLAPAFRGTAWVAPEFRGFTPRPLGLHPPAYSCHRRRADGGHCRGADPVQSLRANDGSGPILWIELIYFVSLFLRYTAPNATQV